MTALLFVALLSTALALPQPWFSHRANFGKLTFYADREIHPEQEAVFRNAVARLRPGELYDPSQHLRAFVISDPDLYSLFARLAFVPPVVPGFNLSLAHNSFVSVAGLNERRLRNARLPYSAAEGDLAQSLAHELIHDYMVGETGFLSSLRLPWWKKEGYAEYSASLALIRGDDAVPLAQRIRILQEQPMPARAREYYSWGLVVEFLCEKKGYGHADVMADGVTLELAHAQMLEWFRAQSGGPPSAAAPALMPSG